MRLLVKRASDQRSYGCSFGDGNPYDFVVVTVVDSTTLFLCAPCFVRTALEMVQAATEPYAAETLMAMQHAGTVTPVPMDGSPVKTRGHNAPAESDDPDLFDAFDSVITPEELGDDFR